VQNYLCRFNRLAPREDVGIDLATRDGVAYFMGGREAPGHCQFFVGDSDAAYSETQKGRVKGDF